MHLYKFINEFLQSLDFYDVCVVKEKEVVGVVKKAIFIIGAD